MGHIVFGRLDDHRCDTSPGPCSDRTLDLEHGSGSLHLVGAPCADTDTLSQLTSSQLEEHFPRHSHPADQRVCNIRV
jgi:hypothetical protein